MGPRLPRAGSSGGGRARRRRLRRTSLVVVIPALLLFGVVLLASALLFAESFDRATSAGRWAGSTLSLLFSTVMVSVLSREVVLRLRETASRPNHEPQDARADAGWRFTPRWKEELRCGSPDGDLVLEMMMHEPHVYFPTEGAWDRQAPDWARDRRAELLAALERWCMAEDIPLTVDERAWVVAGAARDEPA